MSRRPLWFVLALALAAAAPPAHADGAPDIVSVAGRAVTPNGYAPALPCTLALLAPGDRLTGVGLKVSANVRVAPTPAGDFAYEPFGADDFAFDQVNVFHQAQRYLERLQGYGLVIDEIPILVTVQPGIGSGTNYIEPTTFIGTGQNGQKNDAKDSDIIVHELTHAVFNPRMPTDIYPLDKGEASSVAEGLADYFAAAVNGNTKIGEYSSPPNGYYDIRTDPAVYNYGRWDLLPGDPYSRGRVLNGALLALRDSIGETADELVFATLAHHPLRCMPCMADAIRWADFERYGGAHVAAIDAAFASRGIGGGPPSHLTVTGPPWAWSGDRVRYRFGHHCGAGPYITRWAIQRSDGGYDPLPDGADSVDVVAEAGMSLQATLTDRFGATYFAASVPLKVYPSDDPNLRMTGVRIAGPPGLIQRQWTDFHVEMLGGAGVAPYRILWRTVNGVIRLRESDPVVTIRDVRDPVTLTVTYTDALGQTGNALVTLPVVSAPLQASVSGPLAIGPGQVAWFAADVHGGLAPYHVSWMQAVGSNVLAQLDGARVLSSPAGASFNLYVSVRDTVGLEAHLTFPVTVLPTVEAPAQETPRAFRALGSVVARGGALALELPDDAGEGTVELLDLAGRVRARVRLPAAPGARYERALPRELDAGLYFARLVTPAGARVTRFAIVPR